MYPSYMWRTYWPQDKRTVLEFDRQDFGIGDLAVKVCVCEDVCMCVCVYVCMCGCVDVWMCGCVDV